MTATVTCHCPLCGTVSYVTCDERAYDQYVTTRTPIQEIFPDMDLHTRELLISGMCLDCQSSFFEEEDDEEEEWMCNGNCTACDQLDCLFNPANFSEQE